MQNETNRAKLEGVILDVIDNQTDYMGNVVQFMDWAKSYLRAGNMMVSCLVATFEGAPEEQNINALAGHLSDMEAWLLSHSAVLNERYCGLAVFNELLRPARENNHQSDNLEPQG